MKSKPPFENAIISDVARIAGCSIATVSRVLNKANYPVSQDLRLRVLAAARQLGYSPNPYGRMLRTKVNQSIGIIIPSFQNPYFSQIIMGIEHVASKRGYTPMVFASQRNPALERKCIRDIQDKRISCLMLCSVDDSPEALQRYLGSKGRACVFESNFPLQDNVLNASADMFKAAQMATEHLIAMGHRKIAFLTPPLSRSSRHQRLDGCRFALSKHGIAFTSEDVIIVSHEGDVDEGLYEYSIGLELAKEILQRDRKHTALIALNDMIACGVIAGLKEGGLRVPEDISVIGFDDIPNAIMVDPKLTTIRLSGQLIAQRATHIMIDATEQGENLDNLRISVEPELQVRDSVARL